MATRRSHGGGAAAARLRSPVPFFVQVFGADLQVAGPPLAIAVLRGLQVGPEDVAEEAEAAQEFGMWPM